MRRGLVIPLVFAAGTAALAAPAGLTVKDLVAMDRLSELASSGAHQRVAFTVSTLDLEANRRRSDIWTVDAKDGGAPVRLTADPASDSSPVWSPDGQTIYFLSSRSGSSQVFRMSGNQPGEATQVTKYPLDVGAFALSPDGKQLAVALEVFVDCADLSCTVDRLAATEKRKATGRLYDSLLFRHWDTWADGRRSHLFVAPVDLFDKAPNAAAAIDAMKGMDADAPSKPYGGAEEFTFTPDSRGVVFTARDAGREEAWSTNLDLWFAPIDGSAKPRSLTPQNKGTDTGPVFSPDGTVLAYRSMARAGYEADKFRIQFMTWSLQSMPVVNVAAGWDRSPNELVFSTDGKTLYATAQDVGQQSLFAINVATGTAKALLAKGTVSAPARLKTAAADAIAVLVDDLRSPADVQIVSTDAAAGPPVVRTSFNKDRLANIAFGDAEQFSFKGWNNETVRGYVVKPAGFEPGKKYPVAFLIHGGPQGSFGNHFHYRWNPQTYTGAGYAAVMIDFHGSTGYGQGFTDAIRNDWGGKPLVDLQKGLDAAVGKYSWLDGDKVCALGASYGGFMVNWIAGNWPDRFKCLVNHDGNLDERMAYYDTEELWFPEWEHGGTPWEQPAGYAKHNPIDHVAKWKTPMLVIHGGRDYRIPDTQGMATFTALQRRGIPSQFLHFPDENHWVLKPANSILWHDTVIGWLDQWLKKTPASN
ncbi:MAG: S9 family peptidase [Vicinamibacteraceae bacterium]